MVSLLAAIGAPSGLDMLSDLAWIMCVAAATTVLFQRLRQPVVLGYLLAGLIVGPHLPIPLFADPALAHQLSELGVILLMFSLGLEFSLRKLVRVGPTAGLVAVIQCSLMIWLGYVVGRAFGWTGLESLFTGALIAISSTTIIVKAFAEQAHAGGQAGSATEGDRLRHPDRRGSDRHPAAGDPDPGGLGGGPVGGGAGADGRQAGGLPDRHAGGGDAGRARAWCG